MAFAKDVIVKTDGSTIDAKIEEVTETTVKYRKASNPTGPIYSISISGINRIVYENGEVENYAPVAPFASSANEAAPGEGQSSAQTDLNKAELLRLNEQLAWEKKNPSSPYDYKKRASRYRKMAWIGGAGIAAVSLILPPLVHGYEPVEETYLLVGLPIFGGAAIWTGSFLMAAHHQEKLAREAALYSSAIIGGELMNFGSCSLHASINSMNCRLTGTQAFGLGLSLNF